jgi:hypothetical protein
MKEKCQSQLDSDMPLATTITRHVHVPSEKKKWRYTCTLLGTHVHVSLEMKKWQYACTLLATSNLKEGAM